MAYSREQLDEYLSKLKFDNNGLIPAIARQYDSDEVLMLAWMNKESIIKTIETGHVCYWSRSRQKFWFKGKESGNVQMLKDIYFDCDNDSILLMVDQSGSACHTGTRSCFYKMVSDL